MMIRAVLRVRTGAVESRYAVRRDPKKVVDYMAEETRARYCQKPTMG